MSTEQEFAAQEGAQAVAPESAPEEQVVNNVAPVEQEVEAGTEQTEKVGAEPTVPLDHLITQRKKRQKAEQEAAYWRGQAEARAAQEKPQAEPKAASTTPAGPPQPPTLEEFDTFEAYEKAKDEYVIQAAEYRISQKFAQQQRAAQQRTAQQTFEQKFAEAAKEDPTLVDIRNDVTLPVSPLMAQLLQQAESPVPILKYLHKNREEAAKIAKLDPIKAAVAFGKIEEKIAAAPKPEQPRKVSAAPTPISTVQTTAPAVINEDDLPMEEYYKRRTKVLYGR